MLSVETHSHIEQSVESLRPLRQISKIPVLEGFGERVEQTPHIPLLKLTMMRLTLCRSFFTR